jgi:asparagine synthase (glutamine-hydrolysing)
MRSPFLDSALVRTVFRSPTQELERNDVCLRLIGDGSPELLRIPTDRGLSARGSRSFGRIRRGYLEFLFKAEYASDMGMPQWLAKIDHAIAPVRVEDIFLGRHKPFHFRVWYRDALAKYVREVLLDQHSLARPYIDRKKVENTVQGHLKGNRNYTTELHKLLTLELLHRVFIDGPVGGRVDSHNGSATRIDQFANA